MMIRMSRVASVFLFCLLFSTPLFVLPSQANAWCCGCGMCTWWMGCDCAGYGGCAWCRGEEPFILAFTASNKDALDASKIANVIPSIAIKTKVVEDVMELTMGRKCFREKIALSVLGHAGEDLRYKPVHFTSLSS